MGTRERREREKQQQRRRILDAALQIISREGYAAMTMRKLAERIEYSPAAIYLHFKSREEIARELAEGGFVELLERMQTAVEGKEIPAALHAAAQAYVRFALEKPETYRLVFMSDADYTKAAFAEQREDSAGNASWQLLVGLADRLRRASRNHRRKRPEEIAQLILASLHGIVSLYLGCPGFAGAPPETMAKLATDLIASGLAVESRTAH